MTTQAAGISEVKSWDEKPYDEFEGGRKLTRASVTQDFTGDFEGEAVVEYLMAYASENSASYVGLQKMSGQIGGRSGSFVLQLSGAFDGEVARGTWFVVPGSGTGELQGLRGKGGFSAPHGSKSSYTLTYDFE